MALLFRFPHLAQRITTFPTDISDPYGGSSEVYQKCLEQITDGIRLRLFYKEASL
jgi:protein-tyrosine-phosphatase